MLTLTQTTNCNPNSAPTNLNRKSTNPKPNHDTGPIISNANANPNLATDPKMQRCWRQHQHQPLTNCHTRLCSVLRCFTALKQTVRARCEFEHCSCSQRW